MINLKSLEGLSDQINNLNDRESMGLPNSFVELKFDLINESFNLLKNKSSQELSCIIENPDKSQEIRYAAGTLLSLIGDLRIDVFKPKMLLVKGKANVLIGTDRECLDSLVSNLKDTGIKKEWLEKETPKIKTSINNFYLGKYLVTNYEYNKFLLDNPNAEIPTSWKFGKFPIHKSNHPVHTISSDSADEYCKWLSKITNRKFRLPSEYEWEYAATGGESSKEFPWGTEFQPELANTIENQILDTTPVGMYPKGASYFGQLDMAGNVEEYVSDNYKPYDAKNIIKDDLFNAYKNSYRITRGGSFTRFRDLARCKRRHGYYPRNLYVIGFRLAEDREE